MRLLVVDGDTDGCARVAKALERDDHLVICAHSAQEADEVLAQGQVDMIVLDPGLPGEEGLSWCRRLREQGHQGFILMVSAHGQVPDRLRMFDAGADDVLARPFVEEELRLRVRALGRRRGAASLTVLRHDDTEIALTARRASRAGAKVSLTACEWRVLDQLSGARGRLVPRAQILQDIWGKTDLYAGRSLEVIVMRIRRKLGTEWVRTVRNEGYGLGV